MLPHVRAILLNIKYNICGKIINSFCLPSGCFFLNTLDYHSVMIFFLEKSWTTVMQLKFKEKEFKGYKKYIKTIFIFIRISNIMYIISITSIVCIF